MIEIHVNYHFENNEKRDEFYKKLWDEGIISACRAEDGNLKYDYYIPVGKDNVIFLLEQWKDAQAVDVHGKMEHFLKLQGIKADLVSSTDIVKYNVVE